MAANPNPPYRSGAHSFRDRDIVTKFRLKATTNTAPPDADVKAGEVALWFDGSAGAVHLNYKAKDLAGTVTSGVIF
jgi:hypothetical protein